MMNSSQSTEVQASPSDERPRIVVDAEALRDLLFRAGLCARDFSEVIPFNYMTFHSFLTKKTSTKREGTLYWYSQIYKFVKHAITKKVLPIPAQSKLYRFRKECIKESYNYWYKHNESLDGFSFSNP